MSERERERENFEDEDDVVWVHSDLVLRGVTDETLIVGERDIVGSRAVTLIIADDLDTIVLPYTDTPNGIDQYQKKAEKGGKHLRVGRTQVDANSF